MDESWLVQTPGLRDNSGVGVSALSNKWALVMVWLLMAAPVVSSCGRAATPRPSAVSPPASTALPIPVVGVENVYGNLLEQLGGADVSVTSLVVNPNDLSASDTLSTPDRSAMADAVLVVENGLGDSFVNSMLDVAPAATRTVLDVASLTGQKSTANPDLWYDLSVIPTVAQAITQALQRIVPSQSAYFSANLAKFEKSMKPLQQLVAQMKASDGGLPIATVDPAFNDMAAALGMEIQTPAAFAAALGAGQVPSSSAISQEDALLNSKSVRLLIDDAQLQSPLGAQLEQLAAKNGVPVVQITALEPPGLSYQQWMTDELLTIQTTLAQHS